MSTPLVILPDIAVEIGFAADVPVQPPAGLKLNDATLGLLDTGVMGTSIGWTNISNWIRNFTITRSSTRVQGPLWNYGAGTCVITLDNSDGSFDPDNLSGPYVSAGVSQLLPMVPVRIRAGFSSADYYLYSGFADGWLPAAVTYAGEYTELTLSATDAFKVLAGITLPAITITGIGADTGARVKDILTRAGWYTSAERRVIDTGNSLLQGTTLGADALSLAQVAVDSEIGQLYVNGAGAVVFRARRSLLTDTRSNTIQAVFGDMSGVPDGTGTPWSFTSNGTPTDGTYFIASTAQAALLTVGDHFIDTLNLGKVFTVSVIGGPFAGFNNITITPSAGVIMGSTDIVSEVAPQLATAAITRASDDTTIVNDVQATRVGGALQEVTDAASVTKYLFPRTYPRSDLILINDSDALNWANWVLYIGKTGENRFESIDIDPQDDPLNLWPQVLGREIGDRIQVMTRPAGTPTVIAKDCFIAGISHVFNAIDSTWLTTWTLQDATKYGSFLTLDNLTLGRLNFNALTF